MNSHVGNLTQQYFPAWFRATNMAMKSLKKLKQKQELKLNNPLYTAV